MTEKYSVLEQMRKGVVPAVDLLLREGGTAIEDHKIMVEFEDMGSKARKELILVDFQVVDWKYRAGLRFPKSSVEGYSFEKGIFGLVPVGLTMIRRFLIGSPISMIVSSVSASILSKPAFFVEWLSLATVI